VNDDVDTDRAAKTSPDIVDLRGRVKRLEEQVHQNRLTAGPNSYMSASNVIAGVSLLVAALSVVFSITQANRSQVSQQRTELIGYARQVIAWSADSKDHSSEISAVSSQAAALLPKVPNVSATIYRVLAQGLITDTADLDRARSLLDEAQARAEASNDIAEQIYAHRLKARIAFIDRDINTMRRERAASVAISDRYSGNHRTTIVNLYGSFSRVYWAQDEARIGSCDIARRELAKAKQMNPNDADLDPEIKEAQENMVNCRW
jgi:hypothetical protein